MSADIPVEFKEEAPSRAAAASPRANRINLFVCVLLFAAVAAVYWPVCEHQFIYCDDPDYVTDNLHVQQGLSWKGVIWAFTTSHANNWHPVTWLSHMLDCQLFGLNAGAHHVVNVLFHTANTLLLFLLLWRLTGATWRSAFVAALFGVHPLHVESVAWVSERKDVLSTFFFLLTIWSYAAYAARKDKSAERGEPRRFFNAHWDHEPPVAQPLSPSPPREERTGERRPLLLPVHGKSDPSESPSPQSSPQGRGSPAFGIPHAKFPIPHFWYALSLFLFAVGLMSKPMLVTMPFVLLLLDFWPLRRFGIKTGKSNLNVAGRLLFEKVPYFVLAAGASIVTVFVQSQYGNLASVSALPAGLRIENALLSCVIYLKQAVCPVGLAAYYPYLAHIPFESVALATLILLAVSAVVVPRVAKHPYLIFGWLWYIGTLVPVIGLVQVGLQARADRYTYIPLIGPFIAIVWATNDLTRAWRRRRFLLAGAGGLLLGACMVVAFFQVRRWKDTVSLYEYTLLVTTNNAHAHLNLGSALAAQGDLDAASNHFAEAVRFRPDYPEAESNLGFILASKGKVDDAIGLYRAALALKPNMTQTHFLLGNALAAKGDRGQARAEYELALRCNPNHPLTLNDLAWMLATDPDANLRDGARAVRLAERACQQTRFQDAQLIGTLAAAYAEAGRFADAVITAERARGLAAAAGDKQLAARNEQLLELYRQGKPFHEGENPKQ